MHPYLLASGTCKISNCFQQGFDRTPSPSAIVIGWVVVILLIMAFTRRRTS
jgi:hypothetical protein